MAQTCSNCRHENREGAKFCDNCGHPLSLTCWNCAQTNRPQARFCENCGKNLAEQPPLSQSEPTALDPFIPPALAKKLETSRASGAMVGERRTVTMLFCDLKGSTAAAEQLDPEEWTDIMNGAFKYMIQPVYQYEGTVARLMGDAILAFFGAPIAHEDDPQRAIYAGLEIVSGIEAYQDAIKQDWGIDIAVRVGINTGLVIVGAVGSDLRMEYTAMGDAINLAARMEQTAVPGTVQVAEATYHLTSPIFDFEPLGGIRVKGKAEPVQAYRPLGVKTQRGRLRGIRGLDSAMVGRQKEWEHLQTALGQLDNGVGNIVFLAGEAGLGKSRLIAELQKAVEQGHEASWYATEAFSYEIGQPYALFRRLIMRVCGATEQDNPGIIRERLQQLVNNLLPDQSEAAMMVFRTLLGLAVPGGRPTLEGEAFKGRLFVLMSSLWERMAKENPVILVCDDLHWIDTASAELLREIFPICQQWPLLLVCATRPDRQTPAWELKQSAERDYAYLWQEIQLRPLERGESGEMIDNLLEISELPQSILENIKDKAEGNPFYVEEVVRTLIDRGIIVSTGDRWEITEQVADFEIPSNLQSLLIARIDRLDPNPRSMLQRASILGRTFYHRVLAYVQRPATTLDEDLVALQHHEFLLVGSRLPELEYLFRHALMQDAAYSTILMKERRRYHRMAAAAYEAIFPDRLDELSGKIARHYYEAREYGQAGKFFRQAGDQAFRMHANHEAANHYKSALDCNQRAPIPPDDILHLYTRMGRSYELGGDFERAMETYLQLEQIGQQENQSRFVLWSLVSRAVMHATWTPFADSEKAQQTGMAAISLAEEMGDPEAEARAHWSMLLLYFFHDPDPQKARLHGESSLQISRSHGLLTQQGYTLNDLVRVYMILFDIERGLVLSQQAKRIFEDLGDLPMLADNLNFAANLYMLRGELDKAKEATREAGRIARSIGNKWNQSTSQERAAIIHLEAGEYGQCIRNAEEALKSGEQSGLGLQVLYASVQLAFAYAELGDHDKGLKVWDDFAKRGEMQTPEYTGALKNSSQVLLYLLSGQRDKARESFEKIRKHAEKPDFPVSFGQYPMPFMACEIFLAEKEYQRTLDFIGQLLDDDRLSGIPIAKPEFGYYRSRALIGLGRAAEAREILLEAKNKSRSFGTRRLLWKILGLLARIERGFGESELAAQYKAEAGAVIEDIASQPGLEDLRQTFLSLPEVREIIDEQT